MGFFEAVVSKSGVSREEALEIAAWVNERRAFLEGRGFKVRMRYVEMTAEDL